MLDRLLGRAALRERIDELEAALEDCRETRESAEARLEAESERRSEAVSERQAAEERVNRLEDRIAELEDRVERAGADERAERDFRRETAVAGDRRDELLDRLASVRTRPEGAFTAYVGDGGDLPDAVRDAFGDDAALVRRAAPCLALTDDAALVGACLSVPAPPDPFTEWNDRFTIEREWVAPTGSYALALVRSDLFALGEYEDGERVAFHGFDSALKEQHSKGGFSQARFERLRDEQIESHLERCRAALSERTVDRLYVVGERSVLGEIDDEADATAAVDASGDPEDALADAHHDFWTVRVRSL